VLMRRVVGMRVGMPVGVRSNPVRQL